jgi:hypothetical protein
MLFDMNSIQIKKQSVPGLEAPTARRTSPPLKASAHGDFAQIMLRASYVQGVRHQDGDTNPDGVDGVFVSSRSLGLLPEHGRPARPHYVYEAISIHGPASRDMYFHWIHATCGFVRPAQPDCQQFPTHLTEGNRSWR